MFCAERLQRIIMAAVLGVALYLFLNGFTLEATIVQGFVIAMIAIWGLFDFCPANWMLEKMVGKCDKKEPSDDGLPSL
jgi:multisubunit Na+/H+ antiporter MnhE subunit